MTVPTRVGPEGAVRIEQRRPAALGSVLDPRRNSLNAIRLLLAASVVVSHSWPINGWDWEPSLGGLELGGWAVIGFFAISAYLITRSRHTARSVGGFVRARALRIMPAFVVCLLVIAFVFAPLAALLGRGEWHFTSALGYVLRNLPLYSPFTLQQTIGSTLDNVPLHVWDGALWTLFWEAVCYVLIGVLVGVVPRRLLAPLLGTAAAGGVLALVLAKYGVIGLPYIEGAVPPMSAFAIGALLYELRDRVPATPIVGLVVATVLAVVVLTGTARLFAPLLLPLLVLLIGAAPGWSTVGSRYDISYGLYIYGWPVQEILSVALGRKLDVSVALVLAFAITVPLAWLSCRFVEQPALRLKRG